MSTTYSMTVLFDSPIEAPARSAARGARPACFARATIAGPARRERDDLEVEAGVAVGYEGHDVGVAAVQGPRLEGGVPLHCAAEDLEFRLDPLGGEEAFLFGDEEGEAGEVGHEADTEGLGGLGGGGNAARGDRDRGDSREGSA